MTSHRCLEKHNILDTKQFVTLFTDHIDVENTYKRSFLGVYLVYVHKILNLN